MQNHLLEQIFESIDASFSTQAEFLNAFKETKEAQIKAFQKQEEAAQAQIKAVQAQERAAEAQIRAVGSSQQVPDNVKEPEHSEPIE